MSANYESLPQLCIRCKNRDIAGKLKLPHEGEFRKNWKFNKPRVWICHNCLSRPRIERHHRMNQESPPERKVRQALQTLGYFVIAEYRIGRSFYDFALPKFNLIIEIDSPTWHRCPKRKRNDVLKTRLAEQHGWTIKRLSTDLQNLPGRAVKLVTDFSLSKYGTLATHGESPEDIAKLLNESF